VDEERRTFGSPDPAVLVGDPSGTKREDKKIQDEGPEERMDVDDSGVGEKFPKEPPHSPWSWGLRGPEIDEEDAFHEPS